jgi:hypothetical protein
MRNRQTSNPDELVAVFDNIDPTLVSMASDFLKDAGIESFVFDASSPFGGSVLTPARLMVWADAENDARARLVELAIAGGDSGSHSSAESAHLRWFGIPKSRLRDEARRRIAWRRTRTNPPHPWFRVLEVSFCGGILGFALFGLFDPVSNPLGPPPGTIWQRFGFTIGALLAGTWAYRHRLEKRTKTERIVIFFGLTVALLKRLGIELTYSP